jgi:hypothetical protein
MAIRHLAIVRRCDLPDAIGAGIVHHVFLPAITARAYAYLGR